MHTQYQAIAIATRLTGQPIRLGMGSELSQWDITDDTVKLVFITARVKSTRRGMTVTHRGMAAYQWNLINGSWVAVPPVRIDWKLGAVEIWTGHTPRNRLEELEREAWERMCYRPGTAWDPRDSVARENQGYRYV